MTKKSTKTREITFVSEKDNLSKTVTTVNEFKFAQKLDSDNDVVSYEVCVDLVDWASRISLHHIRTSYRTEEWISSFLVTYADGTKVVYEVIDVSMLSKRSEIEKLEISRRYWKAVGSVDWKIVTYGSVCDD